MVAIFNMPTYFMNLGIEKQTESEKIVQIFLQLAQMRKVVEVPDMVLYVMPAYVIHAPTRLFRLSMKQLEIQRTLTNHCKKPIYRKD